MKKSRKALIIAAVCILLVPLVILPAVSAAVYESVFGTRFETAPWMAFSAEDFDGLRVERSDFEAEDGVILAGYKYSKAGQDVKGVVITAHGFGGGGHNSYMPVINRLASGGYYVFAYDAHGNDNSGGNSVRGLPQGIADLALAIEHVSCIEEYKGLPVMLFGHSWGAYSVGNVLGIHPEIKAAVMISGFDRSEDLIRCHGRQMAGAASELLIPYIRLYERLKFGEIASFSAVSSMQSTNARIMIVHSTDDTTVPIEYGFDRFNEAFADSDRFEFVRYEDRGHNNLFYSEESQIFRARLNADYIEYVESRGGEHNAQIKTEFIQGYPDRLRAYEPDEELMSRIIALYDSCCTA